jgi:tetratricopeptide (TPR) repeat protein
MRHSIWAGLVLALCAGATDLHADGDDELVSCARQGEAGSYRKSIEHCTRAISAGDLSSEDLALAYVNRAISYRRLRLFDEAIRDCEKALGMESDYIDAHIACANAYGGKGDFAAGIKHFDEVLRQEPDDAEAHNNRGNLLNQAGDHKQALKEFETALDLQSDFPLALRNRGIVLFNLGQFQDAAVVFEQALEDTEDDAATLLLWLAMARGRAGNEMAPDAVIAAAGDIDRDAWPWPLIAHFGGAPIDLEAVIRKGGNEDPETEALHKQDRDCEASFYTGEMAIIRGQKDEAKRHLEHAAEVCPKTFIEHSGTMAELARM